MVDGIFNQYMLSLGEFNDLTNIDAENLTFESYVVMIFFFMATFFTQITMLNMLIAIMGDSFARSMENMKHFGIQTKLEILISLNSVLPKKEVSPEGKVFLIIAEPADGNETDDVDWEGSIKSDNEESKEECY